jgi:hypothetical protein
MHEPPAFQSISLDDVTVSYKWLGGREKREHFRLIRVSLLQPPPFDPSERKRCLPLEE